MIDRLRFTVAKLTANEATLAGFSAHVTDLMADLAGKSVALIGNARSLSQASHGTAIDSADLVIRINTAPMPAAQSHGTRTDWLAISIPVDAATIAARAPTRLIWMTPKRKRLPWRIAHDPRFALAPADWNSDLATRLRHRPTTGLMLIYLLSRSDARSFTLYGFDFFASLSLSGRRTAADVPHDFGAEQQFVAALADRDPRLILNKS